MSLGGYTKNDKPPPVVAAAIARAQARGAVVVAAAGNNASCKPYWPAAIPSVVAVGATHCGERAWFSNFGEWVNAWADGVDVVSTFFEFQGEQPAVSGVDYDNYHGWAKWSGTSFAAPRVAAALARAVCAENKKRPKEWAKQIAAVLEGQLKARRGEDGTDPIPDFDPTRPWQFDGPTPFGDGAEDLAWLKAAPGRKGLLSRRLPMI
jgi:hypothetical protein